MKEEKIFLSRQCHGNLRRPKVLTLDLIPVFNCAAAYEIAFLHICGVMITIKRYAKSSGKPWKWKNLFWAVNSGVCMNLKQKIGHGRIEQTTVVGADRSCSLGKRYQKQESFWGMKAGLQYGFYGDCHQIKSETIRNIRLKENLR